MTKVGAMIKETYEFVGEEEKVIEFNQINPYNKLRSILLGKHPQAKLLSTRTVIETLGSVQFPVIEFKYELPDAK